MSISKKLTAILLACAMLFAFAACGSEPASTDPTDDSTTAEGETTLEALTTAADTTTTAAADATTAEGETTTVSPDATTVEGETTTAAVVKLPQTKQEILDAYTVVMNKAKSEKPAYNKYEYQELPKDKRNVTGAGINQILGLAGLFMTDKEKATSEPEVKEKGSDMKWFPVYNGPKGCLLTDTSAIKTASCVAQSDGTYKLTIVLNPEINPEPYNPDTGKLTSYTGGMFSPLSRTKDIDPTLVNDSRVSKVIKDPQYELKYYDCKAVLVYNPKTNEIVTLDQNMSVLITCSGKIVVLGEFSGTAVLNNTMRIYNVKF